MVATHSFHKKAFDEGTLTKLELFQLYTREWLPVFLSKEPQTPTEIHLFDFFAGPGTDADGTLGSPLRTLETLKEYSFLNLAGWGKIPITCHFFDASRRKIDSLKRSIVEHKLDVPGVNFDIHPLKFEESFPRSIPLLKERDSAKLLLIDQFGVDSVSEEVFRSLVEFPRTDFLFFISSATLHRFRNHPSIKQRITPASDYFHVHHAVLDYYRQLLPPTQKYYLAPFSIKKSSNIYGLIFGSAHPLGIDKFLSVAWRKDRTNGEADFDINRDHLAPSEEFLALDDLFRPRKVTAFEKALEETLRAKSLKNEIDVLNFCFTYGVTRQHSKTVIQRLVDEGILTVDFRAPDIKRLHDPRPIHYK